MKAIHLILCCLFLTACSVPAPTPTPLPTLTVTPAPIAAQAVVDMFVDAGLEISNVRVEERVEGSPLPNSYEERLGFAVAEVAPKGGQVFTCREKRNCDALYAYFDTLKGIGGPYYYQSLSGLVVAQLNSGLTSDTAAKFQEIVESIN